MGCGDCMSKCFLIFFNGLFLLFGGACCGLGVFVLMDKKEILVLARSVDESSLDAPSFLETAAYALIGTGGFVLFVVFLGCCGAIRKSKCMLVMYAIIVSIILLIETTAVALAVIFKSQFDKYAKDNLTSLLQTRYKGPYDVSDFMSLAFDLAHIIIGCCGIESGAEFNTTLLWNSTYVHVSGGGSYVIETASIPLTCCKFSLPDAFPNDVSAFINSMKNNRCPVTKDDSNFNMGCYTALDEKFKSYLNILISFGACIGLLEIIGIISACCLLKNNDKKKKQGKTEKHRKIHRNLSF